MAWLGRRRQGSVHPQDHMVRPWAPTGALTARGWAPLACPLVPHPLALGPLDLQGMAQDMVRDMALLEFLPSALAPPWALPS